VRQVEPVLLRADRDHATHAALSTIGGAVTVICIALGALLVGVRHPPARAEQMVLLQPQPASPAVQQQRAAAAPAPAESTRIGNWTPEVGQQVARRAAQWLDWPYSFGAGNGDGPTYGHAVDADSRNDGHVFGFDCSGLTLYALSPWRSLPHSAADQYHAAGSYHPALSQLEPGDLIFWSPDGTVNGIGHVAVYAGDGQVVQAPRSGLDVTVTPLYSVERAYMGATRPLT